MAARGKGSALSEMASDLASEGSSVALTGGGGEKSGGEAAMGDLFRSLDAEVASFEGATITPPAKRGPGRPAGTPNRSTLQLQRYLQARGYRDPAEFLASIVSMDTRALAAALKGAGEAAPVTFDQALEALKLQRAAAGELMPYFHQRMPQQVEHTGDAARPLIMIMGGAAGAAAPAASDGAMSIFDRLQNQSVTVEAEPSEPIWSHDYTSHD